MKKAIMNTMIILFALAMCVGCGQSSEQKEDSVPTDVAKEKEQVHSAHFRCPVRMPELLR